MTTAYTLNPTTIAKWGISTAAHEALTATIKAAAPIVNDPAWLAGQLLEAQYNQARARRLGMRHEDIYRERIPAQMAVIAAFVGDDPHRIIADAARAYGREWERLAHERDEDERNAAAAADAEPWWKSYR